MVPFQGKELNLKRREIGRSFHFPAFWRNVMMRRGVKIIGLLFLLVVGVWFGRRVALAARGGEAYMAEKSLKIESAAFTEGGMIPERYTCDGADVSPPLSWTSVPSGTGSLALVADDPDAPGKTWVHWVLFDLPPDSGGLPENVPSEKTPAAGGKQGRNDFGRIGYGGPCPPGGTHRYFFKVYALDRRLDLEPGASKQDLVRAMEGHVLAEGQLMGKYRRR
jgi:Raf kinase inhibitor-like YbhB/YbcL family protein